MKAAISTDGGFVSAHFGRCPSFTIVEMEDGQVKSTDEIASDMSKQVLVWKNKDGTLGFGNVDYPKGDNVSDINVDGVWEKNKTQP